MSPHSTLKAIIVPGNGCDDIRDACFYESLAKDLQSTFPGGVTLRDFPDPYVAREGIWIPFILNELGCNEDTVIIGHSSGASAAMRLIEKNKVFGVVLISAALTDQGIENERLSGYYSRPWEWTAMKQNTQFILQFASEDDQLVSIVEQREVARELNGERSEYVEYLDQGHFITDEVPQVAQQIKQTIQKVISGL
ncbi:hypothetical protein PhCBS80983_g03425 [Powellomyces hirtus]|uniref:AB hydrolase-1 domain-containing protein n=1 Tax=Powellomyces hirtus TaxID=109895 RepID=A0A507E3Q1_9FUNG|nr:hypothetical protein PhCBS80983_g03425 [Powellomyces hirtus]